MQVEGQVQKIRFRNEENGWSVFKLSTPDGPLTCVGTFLILEEGQKFSLEGDLIFHPTYGEQFSVKSAKRLVPTGKQELMAYLSSGIFPHIGEKRAEKLIELYGDKVLDLMRTRPEILLEIKGIGKKKAEEIRDQAIKIYADQEGLLYLQTFDLGPKTSAKILEAYGTRVRERIEENPYNLINDVEGIGFLTADRIARKIGVEEGSYFRTEAGVIYLLNNIMPAEGSCYWDRDRLEHSLKKLLSVESPYLDEALKNLLLNGKVFLETSDSGEERIYPSRAYFDEKNIAAKLAMMLDEGKNRAKLLIEEDRVEQAMKLKLSHKQQEAIKEVAENSVVVITGGPGTGKTTLLRAILEVFDTNGLMTQLAAPTGRAAKRMEESTGKEALTLHRLLGYRGGEDKDSLPEYNAEKLLECKALLVDEVSMVDLNLMSSLISALPLTCRLVLVGDVDQLPSVGPGTVLKDLIESDALTTIKLTEIYRQSQESLIVTNAHRIRQGIMPELNTREGDFFFIPADNAMDCADILEDLVIRRLPDHYGLDPFEDIQVLAAMKRGPCGVEALNERLQRALNPGLEGSREIKQARRIFRTGDKLMQVKNDYQLDWKDRETGEEGQGVYNGDVGKLVEIDSFTENLRVSFDGKIVEYDREKMPELDHAYAITIHKSQGSEFPCIVLPLVPGVPMLLTRNLLYTGISRAKKLCVLLGSMETLKLMLNNDRSAKRNTSLSDRIRRAIALQDEFYL